MFFQLLLIISTIFFVVSFFIKDYLSRLGLPTIFLGSVFWLLGLITSIKIILGLIFISVGLVLCVLCFFLMNPYISDIGEIPGLVSLAEEASSRYGKPQPETMFLDRKGNFVVFSQDHKCWTPLGFKVRLSTKFDPAINLNGGGVVGGIGWMSPANSSSLSRKELFRFADRGVAIFNRPGWQFGVVLRSVGDLTRGFFLPNGDFNPYLGVGQLDFYGRYQTCSGISDDRVSWVEAHFLPHFCAVSRQLDAVDNRFTLSTLPYLHFYGKVGQAYKKSNSSDSCTFSWGAQLGFVVHPTMFVGTKSGGDRKMGLSEDLCRALNARRSDDLCKFFVNAERNPTDFPSLGAQRVAEDTRLRCLERLKLECSVARYRNFYHRITDMGARYEAARFMFACHYVSHHLDPTPEKLFLRHCADLGAYDAEREWHANKDNLEAFNRNPLSAILDTAQREELNFFGRDVINDIERSVVSGKQKPLLEVKEPNTALFYLNGFIRLDFPSPSEDVSSQALEVFGGCTGIKYDRDRALSEKTNYRYSWCRVFNDKAKNSLPLEIQPYVGIAHVKEFTDGSALRLSLEYRFGYFSPLNEERKNGGLFIGCCFEF